MKVKSGDSLLVEDLAVFTPHGSIVF